MMLLKEIMAGCCIGGGYYNVPGTIRAAASLVTSEVSCNLGLFKPQRKAALIISQCRLSQEFGGRRLLHH